MPTKNSVQPDGPPCSDGRTHLGQGVLGAEGGEAPAALRLHPFRGDLRRVLQRSVDVAHRDAELEPPRHHRAVVHVGADHALRDDDGSSHFPIFFFS